MTTTGLYVFGTSILWGQGHNEDAKMHTKIRDWLARRHKAIVRLHHPAHSGAFLKGQPGRGRGPLHGEVPDAFPSIATQINRAPRSTEDRTVVLVEGGINAVGVRRIVNPLTRPSELRQLTRRAFLTDLLDILLTLGHKYPSAEIYVLGYYPILARGVSGMKERLERFLVQFNVADANQLAGIDFVKGATDNSRLFWEESNKQIGRAVRQAASQVSSTISFVEAGFKESEGLFGTRSLLFGLPPKDPQQDDRFFPCARAIAKGRSGLHCFLAATGHPNRRGVARYVSQLKAAIP